MTGEKTVEGQRWSQSCNDLSRIQIPLRCLRISTHLLFLLVHHRNSVREILLLNRYSICVPIPHKAKSLKLYLVHDLGRKVVILLAAGHTQVYQGMLLSTYCYLLCLKSIVIFYFILMFNLKMLRIWDFRHPGVIRNNGVP